MEQSQKQISAGKSKSGLQTIGLTRIKGLLLDISNELSYHGITRPAYTQESLRRIECFSEIEATKVTTLLTQNLEFIAGSKNIEVEDLKFGLRILGLKPIDDIFSFLSPGDVVEIHDFSGIQIYRNIAAFNFISFSLAEILCLPWTELYLRPSLVINAMMSEANRLMSNPVGTIPIRFSEHVVTESGPDKPLTVHLNFKFISPMADSEGQITAVLTTKTCRIIEMDRPAESLAYL